MTSIILRTSYFRDPVPPVKYAPSLVKCFRTSNFIGQAGTRNPKPRTRNPYA